jgi:para-nitrobenzyl esterase
MRLIPAALIALLSASAACAQPLEPRPEPATVTIETGTLIGIAHPNARVFRNIPYAAPPVGALRWAPPQPPTPWVGARPAIDPGVSCPQVMNADGRPNLGAANGKTDEDCLQLNVFAPRAAKAAPVMVWLHGGGLKTGAGWIYDGQNFARDGVVVVTLNYRLGALGYFAHPALTKAAKPGEPLGNYGLMDQMAALKWVKRNIAAFGGDPRNVTIFGESAGGESVLALLATPSAKGFYQKAIVQSGLGWQAPSTLAQREADGVAKLASIGLPATATLTELRAIPADRLMSIEAEYEAFPDGRLMPQTPAQALASGRFNDVPLIIGSNSGEDSLLGPGPVSPQTIASVPPRELYATEAAAGDDALARALFTDRVMGGPARWVAARSAGGKPTWLYYFSYVGSRFRPGVTRAAHAAEIQYVWEYWGRRTPLSAVSADDRAMATLMHGCWVSFARTGRPTCLGQAWPAYSAARDQLLEFGSPTGVRTQFRKQRLDAAQAAILPKLGLTK